MRTAGDVARRAMVERAVAHAAATPWRSGRVMHRHLYSSESRRFMHGLEERHNMFAARRAWSAVLTGSAAPWHVFGLMMRSRCLLSSTLTLPVGTSAETAIITSMVSTLTLPEGTSAETQRVVRQMQEEPTLFEAALTGFKTFSKRKSLLESVSGLVTTIAEGAPKGFGKVAVMEIQFGLRAANTPVAFFSVADNDLLFATTAPHKGAVLPEGISLVTTLIFDDESGTPSVACTSVDGATLAPAVPPKVPLAVYCIAGGLQMLDSKVLDVNAQHQKKTNCVKFAVEALCRLTQDTSGLRTPFDVLRSRFFNAQHRLRVGTNDVCVVASDEDWQRLQDRNVDFAVATTLKDSTLFDLESEATWDPEAKVVVLIGGESGAGKTLEMITTHCGLSHLVVYIRFYPDKLEEDADTKILYDRILMLDKIVKSTPTMRAHNPENLTKVSARAERNTTFCGLVAAAVRDAIAHVCPLHLSQSLKEHNAGDVFEVRVCLDEMGGCPALIRSCCGMGSEELRTTLEWGQCARIRVYAAGTGVGAVENPGGSENSYYKLAILQR